MREEFSALHSQRVAPSFPPPIDLLSEAVPVGALTTTLLRDVPATHKDDGAWKYRSAVSILRCHEIELVDHPLAEMRVRLMRGLARHFRGPFDS